MKMLLIISLIFLVQSEIFDGKFLSKNKITLAQENYVKLPVASIKKFMLNQDVYIIDTRDYKISNLGYLRNSLLFSLTVGYSTLVPLLINDGSNIVLICDESNYKESLKTTEALGHYKILGYAIYDEIIKEDTLDILVAEYNENTRKEVQKLVDKGKYLLDIRGEQKWKETGVIEEAHLIPYTKFKTGYKAVPENQDIYIFCNGGGSALLIMSYLQRAGYRQKLIVMRGGMNKTISEGYPLVPYNS